MLNTLLRINLLIISCLGSQSLRPRPSGTSLDAVPSSLSRYMKRTDSGSSSSRLSRGGSLERRISNTDYSLSASISRADEATAQAPVLDPNTVKEKHAALFNYAKAIPIEFSPGDKLACIALASLEDCEIFVKIFESHGFKLDDITEVRRRMRMIRAEMQEWYPNFFKAHGISGRDFNSLRDSLLKAARNSESEIIFESHSLPLDDLRQKLQVPAEVVSRAVSRLIAELSSTRFHNGLFVKLSETPVVTAVSGFWPYLLKMDMFYHSPQSRVSIPPIPTIIAGSNRAQKPFPRPRIAKRSPVSGEACPRSADKAPSYLTGGLSTHVQPHAVRIKMFPRRISEGLYTPQLYGSPLLSEELKDALTDMTSINELVREFVNTCNYDPIFTNRILPFKASRFHVSVLGSVDGPNDGDEDPIDYIRRKRELTDLCDSVLRALNAFDTLTYELDTMEASPFNNPEMVVAILRMIKNTDTYSSAKGFNSSVREIFWNAFGDFRMYKTFESAVDGIPAEFDVLKKHQYTRGFMNYDSKLSYLSEWMGYFPRFLPQSHVDSLSPSALLESANQIMLSLNVVRTRAMIRRNPEVFDRFETMAGTYMTFGALFVSLTNLPVGLKVLSDTSSGFPEVAIERDFWFKWFTAPTIAELDNLATDLLDESDEAYDLTDVLRQICRDTGVRLAVKTASATPRVAQPGSPEEFHEEWRLDTLRQIPDLCDKWVLTVPSMIAWLGEEEGYKLYSKLREREFVSALFDHVVTLLLGPRPRFTLGELPTGADDDCVICQEKMDHQFVTCTSVCPHHFHERCLKKWNTIAQNCPLCKRLLPVVGSEDPSHLDSDDEEEDDDRLGDTEEWTLEI